MSPIDFDSTPDFKPEDSGAFSLTGANIIFQSERDFSKKDCSHEDLALAFEDFSKEINKVFDGLSKRTDGALIVTHNYFEPYRAQTIP